MVKIDTSELEGIQCYDCGTIRTQLYFNHEVHDYAYKQVTCLECYKLRMKPCDCGCEEREE